jgi:hypothetical protein
MLKAEKKIAVERSVAIAMINGYVDDFKKCNLKNSTFLIIYSAQLIS